MQQRWSLMGTHGVVLFHIAAHSDITMRQMSEDLGLTERRMSQVVRDLAEADLLHVTRRGRNNAYSINREASFRHPTLSFVKLGAFMTLLQEQAAQRAHEWTEAESVVN